MVELDKPVIVNQPAPGDLKVGDYVFASRWDDCDPGDPWAVGPIAAIGDGYVTLNIPGPRNYPYAMRITEEQGNRICAAYPALEEGNALPYVEIARVFNGDDSLPDARIDSIQLSFSCKDEGAIDIAQALNMAGMSVVEVNFEFDGAYLCQENPAFDFVADHKANKFTYKLKTQPRPDRISVEVDIWHDKEKEQKDG